MSSLRNDRGNAVVYMVAAVLIALLVGLLSLHFAQKRHNRLPYDVQAAYPPDKQLVGGEAFASTAAGLRNSSIFGPWSTNCPMGIRDARFSMPP